MSDELYERGMEIRREAAGPEQVEREMASLTEFERANYDLITRYCFGAVWARPGMDTKTRAMITAAICGALNRQGAVKNHVRNALRAGATKEEIQEIMLHISIYCGVPAGSEATRSALEVLRDFGIEQ
jgi:4-carboxymuconolactone decarboxylase